LLRNVGVILIPGLMQLVLIVLQTEGSITQIFLHYYNPCFGHHPTKKILKIAENYFLGKKSANFFHPQSPESSKLYIKWKVYHFIYVLAS
jgi:hypothetical protein